MRYYIETEKTLREATPLETEILDFTLRMGDEAIIKGFDTRVLNEDFEEISKKTSNENVWSKWAHFTRPYAEEEEKGVETYSDYFYAYRKLSNEEKENFWRWIHGEWDFDEEIRNRVAGCNQILLVLKMATYEGNGILRYIR